MKTIRYKRARLGIASIVLMLGSLGLSPKTTPAALPGNCTQVGTTLAGNTLWECPPATPTAAVTATATNTGVPPSQTPSLTPAPTMTTRPTASATQTALPTSTSVATATAAPGLAAVDPAILGTCTAAIHDRYVVTGPDGKPYRTWHPQVVPVDPADPTLGTCTFAHEHGDDPTGSLANPALPPFGYVAAVAGLVEPHEGYKVTVINKGAVNSPEGYSALNSTRVVVHSGTGGAGRFDAQFHSAMFDIVGPNGFYAHLQGMADTGGVGSICANPRQGKTVVTLPGTGCNVTSLYEIWSMFFSVHDAANNEVVHAIFAPAVFDPITILNPADPPSHRATYLATNYFPNGPFFGCRREEYSGPVYWYNSGRQTSYLTDAYGLIGAGPVLQQVSATSALGIAMASGNFYQMKMDSNTCAPGLGVKN